jgi:N-acetylneuraminate synthase/sialic acid synthase
MRIPLFLSTGGATMLDVLRAYDVISKVHTKVCVMQCTASYPSEAAEINLNVLRAYRETLPCVVGLSDHYNGIAMAPIAYVLGARVIEKHFTLNHAWKGTDHAFSLEPIGMRKMVRDLHRAKEALGDGIKQKYDSEVKPLYKMGKKIVAARDLKAGHAIRMTDLALKSPNDGIPPYDIYRLEGKMLIRDIAIDEGLKWEDIV